MKRCKAFTKAGKKCSRDAERGSDFCWQHQDKKEVNIDYSYPLEIVSRLKNEKTKVESYTLILQSKFGDESIKLFKILNIFDPDYKPMIGKFPDFSGFDTIDINFVTVYSTFELDNGEMVDTLKELNSIFSQITNSTDIIEKLREHKDKLKVYTIILQNKFDDEAVELFEKLKSVTGEDDLSFQLSFDIFSVLEQKTLEEKLDKIYEIGNIPLFLFMFPHMKEERDKILGKETNKFLTEYLKDFPDIDEKNQQIKSDFEEYEIFGPIIFKANEVFGEYSEIQEELIREALDNSKLRKDLKIYYEQIEKEYEIDQPDEIYRLVAAQKYREYEKVKRTQLWRQLMGEMNEDESLWSTKNFGAYKSDYLFNSWEEFFEKGLKYNEIYPIAIYDFSWSMGSEPGINVLYLICKYQKDDKLKFPVIVEINVEENQEEEIRKFIKENLFEIEI